MAFWGAARWPCPILSVEEVFWGAAKQPCSDPAAEGMLRGIPCSPCFAAWGRSREVLAGVMRGAHGPAASFLTPVPVLLPQIHLLVAWIVINLLNWGQAPYRAANPSHPRVAAAAWGRVPTGTAWQCMMLRTRMVGGVLFCILTATSRLSAQLFPRPRGCCNLPCLCETLCM